MKRNRVMEAHLDGFAKLAEEGLERRPEAEAFAWREVEGHGDLLDVVFVEGFEVGAARQPAPDPAVGVLDAALLPGQSASLQGGRGSGSAGDHAPRNLFWALLASGQILMRKVDGWETLAEAFSAT